MEVRAGLGRAASARQAPHARVKAPVQQADGSLAKRLRAGAPLIRVPPCATASPTLPAGRSCLARLPLHASALDRYWWSTAARRSACACPASPAMQVRTSMPLSSMLAARRPAFSSSSAAASSRASRAAALAPLHSVPTRPATPLSMTCEYIIRVKGKDAPAGEVHALLTCVQTSTPQAVSCQILSQPG